jgi:hypothetical protein
MTYKSIAKTIIDLRDSDLALRNDLIQKGQLGEGYHEEMEKMHRYNAEVLKDIIDQIGYPDIDKVGKEASDAAWLVIQHAIGLPDFMKMCQELLKQAVAEKKADPLHLAYLSDRIAVLERKKQRYGTQFDWDDSGKMNPNPYDDLVKVNQRRIELGLNTLEEQTAIIRQNVQEEHQAPPKDLNKRKKEMDEWRKKSGWMD